MGKAVHFFKQKRNTFRVGRVLLGLALCVLTSSVTTAQHVAALSVVKTCPVIAAPGSVFQCMFTVQNLDSAHAVINLFVVNQVPYPAGTNTEEQCTLGGISITTLGPLGSDNNACSGFLSETAPRCGSTHTPFVDQIRAMGEDAVTAEGSSGTATQTVVIPRCTPTPSPPPRDTATPTPTIASTRTPGPPPFSGPPLQRTPRATKTPRP